MNKIGKFYIVYPFKKDCKTFLDMIDIEINSKSWLSYVSWQMLCFVTFFSDFTIIKDGPYFF